MQKRIDQKKISVIFLNPFYKPWVGGAEISLEKVINGLNKTNFVDTFLITSNINNKGTFLRSKDILSEGVIRVGFSKSIKVSDPNIWKDEVVKTHYQRLFAMIYKADLIYLNYATYLIDTTQFNRLINTKKPILIKIIYTKALNELIPSIKLIKSAENVYFHCISNQIVDELLKLGISKRRLFICPNPVDTEFFYTKKKPGSKNTLNYIYTGRLAPQKNIPGLIELFNQILTYQPNSYLTIIGRVTHPEMEPVIKTLKKSTSHVSWIDEIPNKEIGKYLRKSDFFIIASKDEGMSNSLLEAMSCGLCPIVPIEISGMKDLIKNNKNGLLYSISNPQKSAKRISNFTYTEAEEMGLNARQTVKSLCSIDKVIERHISFYNSII